MTTMKRFVALASIFLVTATLLPIQVSAQQQVSMKIQPTLIEEKVDPGQVIIKTVSIANLGATQQTLYPVTRDITGIGADGRPIYSNEKVDSEGMSLASWVTFTDKEITVSPGGSRQVTFTITVPKEASPGSHFGGVFLTYQAPGETLNATGVGYEIGTVLNLQISGEIVEEAAIRSFSSNKFIYGEAKVHFTTRAENLGNVFIRPRGLVEIHSMFGKKVATLPVNDAGAGVLPKGERTYETDWLPEDLQIGRYEAIVALSYGGQGSQTISSKTEFWILPVNIVLPVLGGLLAFVLVVYVMLRLYVRRQLAGVARSRRENAVGLSRLAAVIIAILVAIIIGLMVLFFYFG